MLCFDENRSFFFICEFENRITNTEKIAAIKNNLTGSTTGQVALTEKDYEGSTAKTKAEIEKSIAEKAETRKRMQDLPLVTVMDFSIENISKAEGFLIVDLIISSLFNTGRFRVLDRSQRDNILKEMEFSFADYTDESSQIEIGKLLAADKIVVGSVGKVGNRFILNTKLIDVKTGVTMSTAYNIFESLDELVDGTEKVVTKLSK